MAYTKLALILGNHLFSSHERLSPDENTLFFIAEDAGLCTHFKYHKHKLVLFLSAMRHHAKELNEKYKIKYWDLNAQNISMNYEDKLENTLDKYSSIEKIITYDIEDHFFDKKIRAFCKTKKIELEVIDSPLFINSKKQFEDYLSDNKPFMKTFYQNKRKELNILMNQDGTPKNGKWSFDKENRKPFPKNMKFPKRPQSECDSIDNQVIDLVNQLFPEHYGSTENFNWATSRRSALYRLNDFLKNRFEDFGPYEDSIGKNEEFLFHSVLSPYINMGLITPDEVIDKALEYYGENNTHFPSVEGFVRQVIGWREFMRGIYHNFDLEKNKFNHQRKIKDCWYDGTTGIPPLDDSIKKTIKNGWNHHIERLMILGNIMLMSDLHPDEVYQWFMELFVDSSDWVMAPNVYGMSQFAEGGIFATKPYISGSNYILKMSNYSKGNWCDIVDGLYWRFIDKKRQTFENNHRMGMMLSTLDKMNEEKKKYIFKKAEDWIEKVTYV